VLHTAEGPGDPRLEVARNLLRARGLNEVDLREATSREFGEVLGTAARRALEEVPVTRVAIAGGDTSSQVARRLGVEAVEMIAPLVPGAPLCRAFAPTSPLDGCDLNLKGGQVGDETYFGLLRDGTLLP
jgi:uncharacterized protein YgbK (DUF1537 family)